MKLKGGWAWAGRGTGAFVSKRKRVRNCSVLRKSSVLGRSSNGEEGLQEDRWTGVWWSGRIKPSVACNGDGSLPEVIVYGRERRVKGTVDITLNETIYQYVISKIVLSQLEGLPGLHLRVEPFAR